MADGNKNSIEGTAVENTLSQLDFIDLWQPVESNADRRRSEDVLLSGGQITAEQLQQAKDQLQSQPHRSILEILIENRAIDEIQAYQAVAVEAGVPFLRLTAAMIDRSALEHLPFDFMRIKRVIPVRHEDGRFLLAVADPTDIFLLDDIRQRLKSQIRLVVAPPGDIVKVIDELINPLAQQLEEILSGSAEDSVSVINETQESVADLQKVAGESPVIRYVNYLISSAVREGASDIHVEPGEDTLIIRCRIDGVLFEQEAPPLNMHAAMISRLKIMARLDIAERRLPQDGRIHISVENRRMDLRVSTLPTTHGEKCVIRILDSRSILRGLDALGMSAETLQIFRRQIDQPHGIVLVTGPTGSGKSTTLYSALQVMDAKNMNICTVEDPVEYQLPRITQVNVNDGIGLSFAATLRSLLRQDPDIIMVGEIRDTETARVAIQAALTGHLVLSTLHTNDAPSSIIRLMNIGIEPYLIGASLNGVLAQRLVRRICDNCKKPAKDVRENVKLYLEEHHIQADNLCVGAGCEKCRQTGYKGRLGIYEIMTLDETVRDLISHGPSSLELSRAVKSAGMRDLRTDGLEKMAAGLTTVDEIMLATET
jgi:type IV pilus assembly protein PilB